MLRRPQVSTASTLGARADRRGGLVVDNGWLRILGGGSDELPDLASVNALPPASERRVPSHLVVAYDVLGGVFAIDGGGLGVAPGEVCYRGPDTLVWQPRGTGHTGLVHAALSGGLAEFFSTLRWTGWERDVAALSVAQGLSVYLPPFTAEGKDLGGASRRAVPMSELLAFYDDMATQLDGLPPEAPLRIRITE